MRIVLCSIIALLLFGQKGYAEQVLHLSVMSTPQWNEWSGWTLCSATCGYGSKIRSRQCVLNGVSDNGCGGQSIDVPQTCIDQLCSGIWGPWTDWTSCSITCGIGNRIRRRECLGVNAEHGEFNCTNGKGIEKEDCKLQNCQGTPEWSEWGHWTQCTHTCNSGAQARARDCMLQNMLVQDACSGLNIQFRDCGMDICPVTTTPPPAGNTSATSDIGICSQWTTWTFCSTTCGDGYQFRTRDCHDQQTHPVRNVCPSDVTERQHCKLGPCPTDGEWGAWLPWSQCLTGSHIRERMCDNPRPQYGGQLCGQQRNQTVSSETEGCTAAPIIDSLYTTPAQFHDGDQVLIICNITGYPPPIVQWGYKDVLGNALFAPPHNITGAGHIIVIESFQGLMDSGTWICYARNSDGFAKKEIII